MILHVAHLTASRIAGLAVHCMCSQINFSNRFTTSMLVAL
jgi:hypothetical protein